LSAGFSVYEGNYGEAAFTVGVAVASLVGAGALAVGVAKGIKAVKSTRGGAQVVRSVGAAARKAPFLPSANQMNQAIKRGQAPSGFKRVDLGKVKGEKMHVHFDDGSALNIDGTWKHGRSTLTTEQSKWLREHGWTPPTN
jgi:hypothetical protein